MTYIDTLGQQAKVASRQIAKLSTAAKNDLLNQVAKALVAESDYIITENAKDMANASENGISKIMQDRLLLTEDRIAGIAEGVRQVADLQDPIGQVVRGYTNLDGLKIVQKRVPMGVIAMIFESRPNVSIDAFSLAFKTNNAIILRGGRDAINSNKALVTVARKALKNAGITADAVQFVEDTSHEVAEELMVATKYVDLLIPRGGARLIQTVKEKAKVPVIETGVGNCHIYVDKEADLAKAVPIIVDADALNLLSEELEILKGPHTDLIVTPHLGEMSRLVDMPIEYIKKNILMTAQDFSREYNVICVLKDARTITSIPYGKTYVNTSGNHGMATAGSGDVLTGIIAGFLAGGLTPEEAAVFGVYVHGLSGDAMVEKTGYYSLMAEDILDGIKEVLK